MSGLGAVLRVSGSRRNVAAFLKSTTWEPTAVYWRGVLRFKASRTPSNVNGFNVSISDAEGNDLAGQMRDVLKFVRLNAMSFRKLKRLRLHWTVDFAVESSSTNPYLPMRLPSQLIAVAARYGGELEVSCYHNAAEC